MTFDQLAIELTEERQRADAAEAALQTSHALNGKLRKSEHSWRTRALEAEQAVERIEKATEKLKND